MSSICTAKSERDKGASRKVYKRFGKSKYGKGSDPDGAVNAGSSSGRGDAVLSGIQSIAAHHRVKDTEQETATKCTYT